MQLRPDQPTSFVLKLVANFVKTFDRNPGMEHLARPATSGFRWASSLALVLLFLFPLVGCGNSSMSEVAGKPKTVGSPNSPEKQAQASKENSESKPEETDIFAKIWNLSESHIRVVGMKSFQENSSGSSSAQLVVHEQGKGGQCLDQDNAPQPLLTNVDESVFKEPTFKTFIALLDNYTAAEGEKEIGFEEADHKHWKEVDAFLDAVFQSKPMQIAVEHIQGELGVDETTDQIRENVKTMWFQPYTNNYRSAQPFCVGFEHVFIGEDESGPEGAPNCQDRVGGYHSWVKFYLEQKLDKVNYLGYDYPEGNVEDALENPKVATMIMRWSPTKEEDGSHGNDLLKKPGGFFIGTRPELEIVFGALAFYTQQAGVFDNVNGKENHHRVKLDGYFFDLVMHPQTIKPTNQGAKRQRGNHIRTLYPKFRGKIIPESQSHDQGIAVDLPTQPNNDAPIQIVSALPNPSAEGDVGEWVEIKNVSDHAFDLSQWSLKDRSGRSKSLTGILEAGQTKKIILDRDSPDSMMLRNSEGWILLFENDVRRAGVRYPNPTADQVITFDRK